MIAEAGHHLGESFQPGILVVVHDATAGLRAGRMDIHLTAGRGDADADIFDGSAEAGHGVSLEMGENHPVRVVLRVAADDYLREPAAAGHGPFHFAFLIHQIEIRDSGKAVILSHLLVHGGGGAGTAVSRVALHNGAVHLLHQIFDELRAQIVACGRLAGRDLDGGFSGRGPAEGIVDFYETFRGDVGGEIDG